jgi:hypothetical protein
MDLRAKHLLQRPQRLLVGAGLNQHEPTRVEADLAEAPAIGPSEAGESTAGNDQEGGAGDRARLSRLSPGG